MSFRERCELPDIINARGTFTPLGVSRSPDAVRDAVAEALGEFVPIEALQQRASAALARFSGAPAGTVVHCADAAVTLAVAAFMTRGDEALVARLPDARSLANRVVLPAGHAVDYGHPITQAIRLAGGVPELAGEDDRCDPAALERALSRRDVCCLLLVSSRLTRGARIDLARAVEIAHRRGVPVAIDGAAQDMRVGELVATGTDLLILSGQKYLRGPTAGLVVGTLQAVEAVRAQEKGIGRGMKASKEAIAGSLAALAYREALDLEGWALRQADRLERFLARAGDLPGVSAGAEPDATGLPFARAALSLAPAIDARRVAERLRDGTPRIHVMEHALDENRLVLELVPLNEDELRLILARLRACLTETAGE